MIRAVACTLIGAALGWAIGGTVGLIAGTVAGVAIVVAPNLIMAGVLSAPVTLAVVTLMEADTDDSLVRSFATVRPRAHDVGLVMVVIWVAAAVLVWSNGTAEPTVARRSPGSRRRWLLPVFIVAALVLALVSID